MAKKRERIGEKRKTHSHKSAKRLAIKRLMLAERAKKKKH